MVRIGGIACDLAGLKRIAAERIADLIADVIREAGYAAATSDDVLAIFVCVTQQLLRASQERVGAIR